MLPDYIQKMAIEDTFTPKEMKKLVKKGKATTINYKGIDISFIGTNLYSKEEGNKNYKLVHKDWFDYFSDVLKQIKK